eukprot:2933484-Alexandrium_andersonii.AAC.1
MAARPMSMSGGWLVLRGMGGGGGRKESGLGGSSVPLGGHALLKAAPAYLATVAARLDSPGDAARPHSARAPPAFWCVARRPSLARALALAA